MSSRDSKDSGYPHSNSKRGRKILKGSAHQIWASNPPIPSLNEEGKSMDNKWNYIEGLFTWSNCCDRVSENQSKALKHLNSLIHRILKQSQWQRWERRRLKNLFNFFVRISQMAGCVYRLFGQHTSTSIYSMWVALSSNWKIKFAVGVSVLSQWQCT